MPTSNTVVYIGAMYSPGARFVCALQILPSKIDPLVSLMKVEKVPDSTYDMVGGLDKQVKEIKEVVELPIKHPELFESLGVAQPKGVLLYGPPGTGKTLLARAVAHHTDCTFIRVSGGELVQKYIGEGSRMVRELFVMAREHAPSIIFMDEVDSIGSSRGDGGGDSEVQRTMLELLNQVRYPKLTVAFSQSSYTLMTYRVVGTSSTGSRRPT